VATSHNNWLLEMKVFAQEASSCFVLPTIFSGWFCDWHHRRRS